MQRKLLLLVAFVLTFTANAQFSEGFEGTSLPDYSSNQWALGSGTWHVTTNGVGDPLNWNWTANEAIATPPLVFEGLRAGYCNRENTGQGTTSEDWLITPAVTPAPNSILEFMTRVTLAADQGTLYQIRIKPATTDPLDLTGYTTIEMWTESEMNSVFNLYQHKVVSLNDYSDGSYYIAFVKVFTQPTAALGGDRWLIDNVNIQSAATLYNYASGSISYGGYDANCNNGVAVGNIPVTLTTDDQVYVYHNLSPTVYHFITTSNSFTTSITPPQYYTVSPQSYTLNYPVPGAVPVDFCLLADGVHHDVITILSEEHDIKPGFGAGHSIKVYNVGTEPESGTLTFTYDPTIMSDIFTYPEEGPDVIINPGTVTFSFQNLAPFSNAYFICSGIMNTPSDTPPVNEGDSVTFTATATILNTDETPANNTAVNTTTVVAAVDPNDIRVMEGPIISPEQAEGYLHYIIRFQNIGSAAATNVRIRNIIEPDLDMTTIVPLDSSHPFQMSGEGNLIQFDFNGIELPSTSMDENASHGFITYRIKPKSTVGIGSVLTNNANIYFDFAEPITTNTVVTTVTALKADSHQKSAVAIYPNPTNDIVNIETVEAIEGITVFNMLGQKMLEESGDVQILNVSRLQSGTYFIKVKTPTGIAVRTLLKK